VTALDVPADQGPNTVTYSYVSEVWTAPKPPEMAAIDEYYGRYGAKLMKGVDVASLMKSMKPALDGTAINQLFASNPSLAGSVQDFSKKMAEEQAKITGVRILEITCLGGEAMPTASATPPAPPATRLRRRQPRAPAGLSLADRVTSPHGAHGCPVCAIEQMRVNEICLNSP